MNTPSADLVSIQPFISLFCILQETIWQSDALQEFREIKYNFYVLSGECMKLSD